MEAVGRDTTMSQPLVPSRVPPPGRILNRELEARSWTLLDLAEKTTYSLQTIDDIIHAKQQITPETALVLAKVLGTSAEFWINLETNYQQHQAREKIQSTEQIQKSKIA